MIAVQPIANFDAPHTVIEPRDLSVNLAVVQIANEARHLVGELKIRIKFSHADTSRWTEWPYSYPLTPPPARPSACDTAGSAPRSTASAGTASQPASPTP